MKKMFKEHNLVSILSIMLLVVVLLSWFVPTGSFATGGTFSEGETGPIGLVHFFYGFTFGIQNCSIQLAFLAMIGIFYGIVTQTEMYKTLVSNLAKLGKKNPIVVALVISFVIALLASLLNNTLVLVVFMPLLVTVLRRMGFDKISAFATTFGSILVGVLGATIGTEGLIGFVEYIGYGGSEATITTEIYVRIGVLLLSYILFSFFQVIYMKKLNFKKEALVEDDAFAVEEPKKSGKKTWPMALLLVVLLIYAVLGFVSWSTFEIDIFDKFHTDLMEFAIFDYPIIQNILGSSLPNLSYELVPAFGTWYLFTYSIVLFIVSIIAAVVSRMKLSDLFTNAWNGLKKFLRPMLFILLAYLVFVFLYWSPIIPTIINEIGRHFDAFNPFIVTIQAFLGSIFNSDFAYLGFTLSYSLGSYTGNEGNIVYLIYSTIYGLVQFVTPISVFLLFGLSYMNLSYSKWIKYIWKFFVGMLVCLVVIFALLAYL